MKTIELGNKKITIEDVIDVATQPVNLVLGKKARERIERSHQYLLKRAKSGDTIYGVNTGLGPLSDVKIKEKDLKQLQVNLLRSHAVGAGGPLKETYARAMVFLRAVTLMHGNSGVSIRLVEGLLELINRGVTPWIPTQGSVGASGDLCPLAHLSLVLIGEGRAYVEGKLMKGGEALKKARLKPIVLGPKEGLALINGTQFMAALAVFAVIDSEQLLRVANVSGALTVEALRGTSAAFDHKIHDVRPHPGQMKIAKIMRDLLDHPQKSEIALSHENCGKVQDPYSLRCIPQVHGVTWDTIRYVRKIVETEINAVTDNPLVFPKENEILSGGNFHGQYLAMAMDFLSIAMAEIASISERRIDKLVNPIFSGLPAFLTKKPGTNSGFMILQYSAASIVSENKTLAHPASVDSIPTSLDKEDHVSMGAWAARKCLRVVTNVRRVLAMELIVACQGLDMLAPLKTSPKLEKIKKEIREKVPYFEEDAPFFEAIEEVDKLTYRY